MSIEQFHATADHLIDTAKAFIEANIEKIDNVSWECQQTSAMNDLMRLSNTFDGTAPRDLTEPQGDHQRVFLELDRATAEALIEAVNIATLSPQIADKTVERAQEATTRITDALVG